MISKALFLSSALELRALEAELTAQVSRLRDTGMWQGADANQYYAQWDADVRARLLTAATQLEMLVVMPA